VRARKRNLAIAGGAGGCFHVSDVIETATHSCTASRDRACQVLTVWKFPFVAMISLAKILSMTSEGAIEVYDLKTRTAGRATLIQVHGAGT
jgi:hypothetical protein